MSGSAWKDSSLCVLALSGCLAHLLMLFSSLYLEDVPWPRLQHLWTFLRVSETRLKDNNNICRMGVEGRRWVLNNVLYRHCMNHTLKYTMLTGFVIKILRNMNFFCNVQYFMRPNHDLIIQLNHVNQLIRSRSFEVIKISIAFSNHNFYTAVPVFVRTVDNSSLYKMNLNHEVVVYKYFSYCFR